jgi:bacteriorhodopsin
MTESVKSVKPVDESANKIIPLKYGDLLYHSFMTTYVVLFGYTAITLVEALRTPSTNTRHIMNIETTVSMVAGIVYGTFVERIKRPDFKLEDIIPMRYIDWTITTPLILLALVLFYNRKENSVNYKCYGIVIILNWLMLLFGYLGERKVMSSFLGLFIGFVFFAAMLIYLYMFLIPKGSSLVVFIIFSVIWSLYGVAYLLEEEEKNIAYNILDITSKAVFGVVLWLYFGKVLEFK